MWNGNNTWRRWPDEELKYKPERRMRAPPQFRAPYAAPKDLYKNFVTADLPHVPQAPTYDSWRRRHETWRKMPEAAPLIRPPPITSRNDYWTPRAVAPKICNPYQELWNDFGAPAKPVAITFLVWKSAKECGIKWDVPSIIGDRKNLEHLLKVFEISQGKSTLVLSETPNAADEEFRWATVPGLLYVAELRIKNKRGLDVALGSIEFKAIFSIAEMRQLLKKALDYCGSGKLPVHPFSHVYRCKPMCYWQEIRERTNGIMRKYIKDDNGQAASPINGFVYGLFFSARLLPSGFLPPSSPFGDLRMTIPAPLLLDPELVNFYFSDFYCNKLTHYVTVVICKKGSESDLFCRARLIPLHPDNPFVSVTRSIFGFEFQINKKVWVELYYTESVPLSWGRFDRITATGLGTSKIGGLPHNKTCTICNLYPLTDKAGSLVAAPYEEELEEGEKEAQQQLADKVSSMRSMGLPLSECEDIVFLVGNLIDRVVHQAENSVNVERGSAVFGGKTVPLKDAMHILNDPGLSEGPYKAVVSKLKRVHESITKNISDLSDTIRAKKRKVSTPEFATEVE